MTTSAPVPLPRSRPEDAGVPPAALEALLERWERVGVEAHGLVVLRQGAVLAQADWAPYTPDGIRLVYSVSKTFTACAVGFAVADGLLRLEDRLVDLFPEAAHLAGSRASTLTLHHVLSMSTGHRTDTLTWRGLDEAGFAAQFLAVEPEEEPGSWFVYHNGATLMAALAVQRATGQRLLDHLRPRLLDPLGVGAAAWQGKDGLDLGYSGLHVTTEALARLGELLRLDGVWEGRRILPEGWVERMTSVHVDTASHPENVDWQQGYGYQVWRCRHDAYRADGAWGQFSVVHPPSGLVLAVTSTATDTQALLDAVWEELLAALSPEPLPHDDDAIARLEERLSGARLEPVVSDDAAGGHGRQAPPTARHEPDEDHPSLRSLAVRATGDAAAPWELTVDDGASLVLAAGDGTWAGDGPWSASAGWTAPGVFEAVVVARETPHVLHLRAQDGRLTATWNGRPLGWPALVALRAPREDAWTP
ncbi:serine hydrolase [Arthrobacter sp. NEB 688]|uniref:serine hydrolase domain-containing protein n=1 Tax=Arthrobacter sp. NEB 688 TaxID=904039 RepID=UPI0015634B08|nr:serine hydrolase [Arthrobacter sp. NEB 688]QKE84537.1 serine hydrolase [Arthrobacter sp. NEB 688]